MEWHVLHLNPEPWTIGPLSVGRNGGKVFPRVGRHEGLYAYQQAVKEQISQDMFDPYPPGTPLKLSFFFWRQQATYVTPQARTHRKHEADVTNLQKALEDALQGVLYHNDKDVKDIRSVMIEQGPDVLPRICILIERFVTLDVGDIPNEAWDKLIAIPDHEGEQDFYGSEDPNDPDVEVF